MLRHGAVETGAGRPHHRAVLALVLMLMLALAGAGLGAGPARAQHTESTQEVIGTHKGDEHPVDHKRRYAVPDLPPATPRPPEGAFSIRPVLVLLVDHTRFWQDDNSIAQVGPQENDWEFRAARLSFIGHVGSGYKVNYQIAAEYKGFDGDPDTTWSLTDLSLTFPLNPRTKLQVGKTKETFAYEMVGDAANLPNAERVLSPFFVSRNTGFRLTHVMGANRRGTLSAGVYNDRWDLGTPGSAERGVDVSARVSALIWDQPEANRFLHVATAFRSVGADGTLRYRGRPGSNVASNFVDTGAFPADGALHFGAEGLLNVGPVSFLGEYVVAQVDAPTQGNPEFAGWYLGGSWILTGETRPYDRNVGYARRVIPKGRWGAPELVARFARVDLDDGPVRGGRFDRLDAGANWWATTRWRFALIYGHVWNDRDGLTGETDTLLTRIQWIY
jgi:phosphate-selective porin OprO/OprP